MLDPISIGNRIKEKQEEHHFKQKEIVEKTGISKSAMSNYISGNRVPDTETILKLSYILETSVEWLLTGKSTNENYTEEERDIIKNFRELSEKNKGKVGGYIQALIEPDVLNDNEKEKLSKSKIG